MSVDESPHDLAEHSRRKTHDFAKEDFASVGSETSESGFRPQPPSFPEGEVPAQYQCTVPDCGEQAQQPAKRGSLCSQHLSTIDQPASDDSSLVSNGESRTPPGDRDSDPDSPESVPRQDTQPSDDDDWTRQQKRTFHRVHTLLSYWDQHDYQIRWITLTSGPDCDDSDELAYNTRRLRQTVERAHLARDRDGDGHSLEHIREIEQLAVRTSENQFEDKGVMHLFWAWKPPGGQHSRSFYIPQDWLARQWGRIHGPYDEHSEEPIKSIVVDIRKYGCEDYHSAENMARYLATQYLGEHAEALENVSWSWERTLGGSVTDAWDAIKNLTESVEEAIETWHKLLGGNAVTLSKSSKYSTITKRVVPPPDLSVELVGQDVHPPPSEESEPTITTTTPSMPEHDPADGDRCQDCPSVIRRIPDDHEYRDRDEHGRAEFYCLGCKQLYAEPGEGGKQIVDIPVTDEHYSVPTIYRQSRLYEFGDCDD